MVKHGFQRVTHSRVRKQRRKLWLCSWSLALLGIVIVMASFVRIQQTSRFLQALWQRFDVDGMLDYSLTLPTRTSKLFAKQEAIARSSDTNQTTELSSLRLMPKNELEQTGRVMTVQEFDVGSNEEALDLIDIYNLQQSQIQPQYDVPPPPQQQHEKKQPIYFLQPDQVLDIDSYSAAWLQRRSDFFQMAVDDIKTLEDASFMAFRSETWQARDEMVRMPADYLDFSVEHLSKWWYLLKLNDFENHKTAAISKLEQYIQQAANYPVDKKVLESTIAVIPFSLYSYGDQLNMLSIASTVESLRRAGMGRAIVVGLKREDELLVQQAFAYLAQHVGTKNSNNSNNNLRRQERLVENVGHMEVAFCIGSSEDANVGELPNIPRASLLGLKKAFTIATAKRQAQGKQRPNPEQVRYMKYWLGRHVADPLSHWEYVYFTEPDSPLVSRPRTLQYLKAEVDQGRILIPHRLQPIPHASDLEGSTERDLFLPSKGAFEHVLEIDNLGSSSSGQGPVEVLPDTCCDEFKGPDFKPGPDGSSCNNFWYMCDLNSDVPVENRTFANLKHYQLIRLKHGTGIVHVSGTEHGRRCQPQKNSPEICQPPPHANEGAAIQE